MKIRFLFISILFLLFSCKDDDDEIITPNNPSAKTQVSINELILDSTITTTLNPSGLAPLTAELTFNTIANSNVEITVLGNESVYEAFDKTTTSHTIPILGLYAGTTNRVALKISTSSYFAYDTISINTDSLPDYFPSITINTANTSLMEDGMNLNTLSITDGTSFRPYPLIYDRNGDIRWYLNLEKVNYALCTPMERLPNGNILFEKTSEIKEYDMMGREIISLAIPQGYESHHDIQKLPNGNYIVAVNKLNATVIQNGNTVNTIEDHILELSPAGQIVTEWDLREILDVDRDDQVTPNGGTLTGDWFHMNAIFYNEADNSLIISGQKQAVIKIDWDNKLKWILAPHKGWGNAGRDGNGNSTNPFLLTAVNAQNQSYDTTIQNGTQSSTDFGWNWGQHAPLILPNGNLLLFDNGLLRNYQTGDYSRAVEYEINESAKTVKQKWQYGKERGLETYSSIISDVDYLPNTGNILFSPGISFINGYSKIVEITYPSGNVVFEGTLNFKNKRSTGGGFGQFDLTYRAERLSLYP